MAQRPDDLPDALEGLPSDDPKTVSPVAFDEAHSYGHGDDDRLVSADIDEKVVVRPQILGVQHLAGPGTLPRRHHINMFRPRPDRGATLILRKLAGHEVHLG